jgi:soluble lytic murein transglycosylase-like protein
MRACSIATAMNPFGSVIRFMHDWTRVREAAAPALIVAAIAAGAVVCSAIAPATVAAGRASATIEPPKAALARLALYDELVDYFTDLAYGPSAARIPADYVRALVLAESAAVARARSPKGARGLTQIMPLTGYRAAFAIASTGVDYDHIDERKLHEFKSEYLYDPAINLLICCYLSATYREDYGGRTDLTAAAWNAGPRSVERYGRRPPPYPETRRFLERLQGYMAFFGGGRVPPWPMRSWDAYGFDAPGWHLRGDGDVLAPAWKFPERDSYER